MQDELGLAFVNISFICSSFVNLIGVLQKKMRKTFTNKNHFQFHLLYLY